MILILKRFGMLISEIVSLDRRVNSSNLTCVLMFWFSVKGTHFNVQVNKRIMNNVSVRVWITFSSSPILSVWELVRVFKILNICWLSFIGHLDCPEHFYPQAFLWCGSEKPFIELGRVPCVGVVAWRNRRGLKVSVDILWNMCIKYESHHWDVSQDFLDTWP